MDKNRRYVRSCTQVTRCRFFRPGETRAASFPILSSGSGWLTYRTIFVHDELKSGKNVRLGSRHFSPSLISAVESHAQRGTFLLPSSASASPFYLPVFCPAPPVGSPLRAVLAVSPVSCAPLGSAISLVPPRPGVAISALRSAACSRPCRAVSATIYGTSLRTPRARRTTSA